MLLSADWFAPYWKVFGFITPEHEQAPIQRAAREAVRDMMKDRATYWNVDFNDERTARTERIFLESLHAIGGTTMAQIRDLLANDEAASKELATTLWLFGALCDQFAATGSTIDVPGLDHPARKTIRTLWMSSAEAANANELEQAALTSTTQWDSYLRNLTPDLQTSLSDWAAVHLRQPDRFRRFWAHLFWLISARDRQRLLEWLTVEAKSLADPAFELAIPDWMRAGS
jgi:hypothetical protein